MRPLHRYFFLEAYFANPTVNVTSSIDSSGIVAVTTPPALSSSRHQQSLLSQARVELNNIQCHAGESYCQPKPFLHFKEVLYSTYNVTAVLNASALPYKGRKATYSVFYGSESFTRLMLGVRYGFCALTGLVISLVLLEGGLRGTSLLQALAILLVLFNNPLYYFQLYLGGGPLRVVDIVFANLLPSMYVIFWLYLFHVSLLGKKPIQEYGLVLFYVPKIAGGLAFLALAVTGVTYQESQSAGHLKWTAGLVPVSAYDGMRMGASLLLLLTFLVGATVAVVARQKRAIDGRHSTLLGLSVLVALMVTVGHVLGGYTAFPASPAAWILSSLSVNLYGLLIMYLYRPISANALRGGEDLEDSPALKAEGKPASTTSSVV